MNGTNKDEKRCYAPSIYYLDDKGTNNWNTSYHEKENADHRNRIHTKKIKKSYCI